MQEKKKAVIIATDGGAIPYSYKPYKANASAGVIARTVEYDNEHCDILKEVGDAVLLKDQSSNVGELTAYGMGLRFAQQAEIPKDVPIIFVMDSTYTYNSIHTWYESWIKTEQRYGVAYSKVLKNGKYVYSDKPIKNFDLIKEVHYELEKFMLMNYKYTTLHVHSHLDEDKYEKERKRVIKKYGIEIPSSLFTTIMYSNAVVDGLCKKKLKDFLKDSKKDN